MTIILAKDLAFPHKAKHTLTYDSTIPFLDIKKIKRCMHTKKACTRIFKSALFILAQSGKYPREPKVGEEINKLWYIHKMEYYSAVKRIHYYYGTF